MSINSIDLSARLVFALCSFSLVSVILLMIRTNAIKEKYVLLWLPLGAGFFVASLFPDLLVALSRRIQLHYITVVVLGVIVIYTGILLYFTARMSQLREDVKKLAQEIALGRPRESRGNPDIRVHDGKAPDSIGLDASWMPAGENTPWSGRPL